MGSLSCVRARNDTYKIVFSYAFRTQTWTDATLADSVEKATRLFICWKFCNYKQLLYSYVSELWYEKYDDRNFDVRSMTPLVLFAYGVYWSSLWSSRQRRPVHRRQTGILVWRYMRYAYLQLIMNHTGILSMGQVAVGRVGPGTTLLGRVSLGRVGFGTKWPPTVGSVSSQNVPGSKRPRFP